jgi:hypothetical protein
MSEYNDWMAKKYGGGFSPYENPLPIGAGDYIPDEDLSGPIGEGVVESGKISPQQMAISPTQNNGGNIAGMLIKGGMATGNPEIAIAGKVLETMGGIRDTAKAQQMNDYRAEVARITARQNSIARMSQIGQGLKA